MRVVAHPQKLNKKNNRMGTRSTNTLKLDIQVVNSIVLLLVISTLELW